MKFSFLFFGLFYFYAFERQNLKKFSSDLHQWGFKMKINILPTILQRDISKFFSKFFLRIGEGAYFGPKIKKNEILNLLKNQNEIDNFCSARLFADALAMFRSKNQIKRSTSFWDFRFWKLGLKFKFFQITPKISKFSKKVQEQNSFKIWFYI